MRKKDFLEGKISSQMFDIRPVDQAGNLDVEKIKKIKRTVKLDDKFKKDKIGIIASRNKNKKAKRSFWLEENNIFFQKEQKRFKKILLAEKELAKKEIEKKLIQKNLVEEKRRQAKIELAQKKRQAKIELAQKKRRKKKKITNFFKKQGKKIRLVGSFFGKVQGRIIFAVKNSQYLWKKYFLFLTKTSLVLVIVFFLFNYVNKGLKLEKNGLTQTQEAFAQMLVAKDNIKNGNFEQSLLQFNNVHQELNKMNEQINSMGGIIVEATRYVPYLSKISSGKHLIKAGDDISQIGILISRTFHKIDKIKKQKDVDQGVAYLNLFKESEGDFQKITSLLEDAQNNLDKTNIDDIPEKNRAQFITIKQEIPHINKMAKTFLAEEDSVIDILGGNTPRKYLFLFQNNQEMRATGGFIGSYGLLDIFNGKVRKFFVDGIYNIDGQLETKIVPPAPIQKMSVAWSLHDSNWWPNFPTSAEKAIWFYEKEGGPTVDGVVALTPNVLQSLLKITGPIDMPKYGLVINENNFITAIQEQVEVNYDKTLNHPKRILADLAPKILAKLMAKKDFSQLSQLANVILKNLNEKQILVYSRNWKIEQIFSQNNWGGEILTTPKDYLSVINTNINGFKTDGVIDEQIHHQAEIKDDGTIIDTVTIKRTHKGGDTPFEWWNKVNADYMRIYVPQGSRLISAEGQTREFDVPPLNYGVLGFKKDAQIEMENDKIKIDENSGTKIYNESGKTVFANWVYVSPGESVTIKYVYALPFKINMNVQKLTDTYSFLAQKQSGSVNNRLLSEVRYPKSYKILWKYPQDKISKMDNLGSNQKGFQLRADLKTDKFMGLAFSK